MSNHQKKQQSQQSPSPRISDIYGRRNMLQTFLSVFIIFFVVYGIDGLNGTNPPRLYQRVNDTINISCSVETADGILSFWDGKEIVSEEQLNRFNDTYIVMTYVCSKPTTKNFTCKQNKRNIVGYTLLSVVDDTALMVSNFKCRTSDLEQLNCTFAKPNNKVPTKYQLNYTNSIIKVENAQCELKPIFNRNYLCIIRVSDYGRNYTAMSFNFTLNSHNSFADNVEVFKLDVLETLIPNRPEEIRVLGNILTHNSAIIEFKLPNELQNMPEQLMFDVDVKNDVDGEFKTLKSLNLEISKDKIYLGLDALEYSYSNYNVRIRIKSKFAVDTKEMWSKYSSVSFQTKARIPDVAPIMCENCFSISDYGNVYVYWKDLKDHEKNGRNFRYLVHVFDENDNIILSKNETYKTVLMIGNDVKSKAMHVKVFSANKEGVSNKFSAINVTLIEKELASTQKLLKFRKELNDPVYRITWKLQPDMEKEIKDFTLFWCHSKNEIPNQCESGIEFETVAAFKRIFELEAISAMNFAIIMNYKDPDKVSMGMQWAECTASKSNEIGKVHSLWSPSSGQHSLNLEWKVSCADESIVAGYNISYCIIADTNTTECEYETLKSQTILLMEDEEVTQTHLSNLKPWSFYKITVALMSHHRLGPDSDFIVVRTAESVPSPPINLKALEVTNNSIAISWDRPLEINGPSLDYQVWFNDKMVNIDTGSTVENRTAVRLENLASFTNYTISVLACTNNCSVAGNTLKMRTSIGVPGTMLQPEIMQLNEKLMKLQWIPPNERSGYLNYYQLRKVLRSKESNTIQIYRLNGNVNSCILSGIVCQRDEIEFTIRAINIEDANDVLIQESNVNNNSVDCFLFEETIVDEHKEFHGEWSSSCFYICHFENSWAFVGIGMLGVFICMLLILFYRLYIKYKLMRDIKVILPNGFNRELKSIDAGTKNLDLIQNLHTITEECEADAPMLPTVEEKEYKVIKMNDIVLSNVPQEKNEDQVSEQISVNEKLLPFICDPRTDKIFYQMPIAVDTPKHKPVTLSPINTSYTKFIVQDASPSTFVNYNNGYTKMNPPTRTRTESNTSIEGYCDMSGKSTSPTSPPPIKMSNYQMHDIKSFLNAAELNNNGYIGKRTSLGDSNLSQKVPPVAHNNSDYTGIQLN